MLLVRPSLAAFVRTLAPERFVRDSLRHEMRNVTMQEISSPHHSFPFAANRKPLKYLYSYFAFVVEASMVSVVEHPGGV